MRQRSAGMFTLFLGGAGSTTTKLGVEAIKALIPQVAIGGEEAIEGGERLGLQRIETALTVFAHPHEAGVVQHLQMARDP